MQVMDASDSGVIVCQNFFFVRFMMMFCRVAPPALVSAEQLEDTNDR